MLIEREWFTDKSTIGVLSFDGVFFCYTLEDTCRRQKVHGQTAIPSGRYEVVIDWSERFKKMMPRLLDVPGFTGVRIHAGNTPDDTDGCIIVGNRKEQDAVLESSKAYQAVVNKIEQRLDQGKVYVTIVGGVPKEQFRS